MELLILALIENIEAFLFLFIFNNLAHLFKIIRKKVYTYKNLCTFTSSITLKLKIMKTFEKKLLKLSVRTLNCLKEIEVYTVKDLFIYKDELKKVRNFGRSSMLEVEKLLSDEDVNFNNGQVILNGISIEGLVNLIANSIIEQVKDIMIIKEEKIEYDLLTREQTCKLLSVDQSTLFNWDKQNILNPYRIGSRVYYKRSEIESKLK